MSRSTQENQSFLEAIRESPDDDVARLIYADWLDDHGDAARAEFIRVQCELARGPSNEERRDTLESREHELLAANRRDWLGPLDRELNFDQCTFRRGFPEDVTVRPKVLVAMADEFDARVPAGRVTLCGGFGDPAMKALLACPRLGWVVGLKYEHPRVTEDGLVMLADTVNLPRLTELSVQFATTFTTDGLRALATSPHRGALHAP